MSNNAAGFASVTDRSVGSPTEAFNAGLQTRPVSRPHRQPATELPDSHLDQTHTSRRRRASDQTITVGRSLLITGHTSWSARCLEAEQNPKIQQMRALLKSWSVPVSATTENMPGMKPKPGQMSEMTSRSHRDS